VEPEDKKEIAERTVKLPDGRTLIYSCYLSETGAEWIRHGPFREILPSGVVVGEGEYKDGKESGIWRDRHDNGIVAAQGSYTLGLEQGWWHFWDDTGREERADFYRNGVAS